MWPVAGVNQLYGLTADVKGPAIAECLGGQQPGGLAFPEARIQRLQVRQGTGGGQHAGTRLEGGVTVGVIDMVVGIDQQDRIGTGQLPGQQANFPPLQGQQHGVYYHCASVGAQYRSIAPEPAQDPQVIAQALHLYRPQLQKYVAAKHGDQHRDQEQPGLPPFHKTFTPLR